MRNLVTCFVITAALWGDSISRSNRTGDKLVVFENPQHVSIFSTVSGSLELRQRLDLGAGVRDFDLDSTGAVYFLTKANEIVKWRPQAAGFEFRLVGLEGASAITVDSAGERLFVASSKMIVQLDAEGRKIAERPVANVDKLRFDDGAELLYAQGPDFIASLPASLESLNLHSAKGGVLPGASSTTRAAAYPTGFVIEPPAQTVVQGGVARFFLRTIPREQVHGALSLAVDSPLPYQLERNALTLNDAVQLQINVPPNQAPGVYRVVARLEGGAAGIANAVFIVPFPRATVVPIEGTAIDRVVATGLPDPNYRLISSPNSNCATAMVVFKEQSPVGAPFWSTDGSLNQWISGRADANNGCAPGLYRYRHDFDLRLFDPTTANIAVAAWGDNAVTLEINGTPIPAEPQDAAEPENFRIPRVYGLPRSALRQGTNSLDFIVRNDPYLGLPRNPTGLRVQILNATAVPVQSPEPPPVGDFWLSLTPPFKFVNGTTVHYTINVHRTGGFTGTPNFFINITPPTGYSATINGSVLTVTRDPNVVNAPTSWRFAVLGIFNQTTRSVDGAFIQNPFVPVDLPLVSTGVVSPGIPAADNSIDARYTLASSPDPNFPGPGVFVANFSQSPFGPWVVNDQNSKWISPRPDPNNLNAPGVYRYRTTFDLGLGDANSAAIALRWAADNDSKVYLNGLEVAALFSIENFRRLNEALITEGFKQGVNVLEFAVNNANLSGSSQTGLRVEMIAAQAARNPIRVVQVLRGRTSTGPVLLSGTGFTFTAPAGVTVTANATNLLVSASDAAPLGVNTVNVNYNSGARATFLVVVGARESVAYVVHSTGQADEGTIDPNYRLIQSVDLQFPSQDAYVILSNTSPVSLGFWAPNQINSRWIAPRTDTLKNNAPGLYRYRTTFDLSGRNLNGAMLALEWACDNRGTIELNGVKVDEINIAEGFRTMRPVTILSGFRQGINTLDFLVVNDGAPFDISPTGLHVNILGAFAVSQGTNPGPDYIVTPDPGVRVVNAGQSTTFDVRLVPNFTFVDPVFFSVVNPPAGFSFSFNPVSSRVSTVLTVTASAQVVRGTYPVTIRARYGDIIRDVTVRVDVAVGFRNLVVASTGGASVGSADPNYTLLDGAGAPLPAYVTDMVDSPANWSFGRWISPAPTVVQHAPGVYRYRTSFDLTGYNPSTAEIRGTWDADEIGECYLNGVLVATLTKADVYSAGPLLINSGFRPGVNTLEFVVTNTFRSATGLMVSIQSATAQFQ